MKNLFFKNTSRLLLATTLLTAPVFAGHDLIEGENFDAIRGITVSKPTYSKLDVEAEDGKADIQDSIYTFDVEVQDEKADIQAAIQSENHPLWDSQARVYFYIEGSQSLDHLPPVLSRLEHLNSVYIQCKSYDGAYFAELPESTLDLSCLSGFKGFNITISGYTNIDSTPLCGASTAEFSDIHTLTGEKELAQKGVDVTVDSNWLEVDQKEESANNANTETRQSYAPQMQLLDYESVLCNFDIVCNFDIAIEQKEEHEEHVLKSLAEAAGDFAEEGKPKRLPSHIAEALEDTDSTLTDLEESVVALIRKYSPDRVVQLSEEQLGETPKRRFDTIIKVYLLGLSQEAELRFIDEFEPAFDPEEYRDTYPDLQAAWKDLSEEQLCHFATQHYLVHVLSGTKEGRNLYKGD